MFCQWSFHRITGGQANIWGQSCKTSEEQYIDTLTAYDGIILDILCLIASEVLLSSVDDLFKLNIFLKSLWLFDESCQKLNVVDKQEVL